MDRQGVAVAADLAGGEGFEEMYAGNFSRLARQLYFVTGDAEEARDCLQEAFARAWLRWPAMARSRQDPVAWVCTVAYRIAVSRWRRRMVGVRVGRRLGDDGTVQGPDPNAVAIAGALGRLPHGQRAVIVLHYYQDLQVEEIARLLGLSTSGVKSRLMRARQALGPMLCEEESEDA